MTAGVPPGGRQALLSRLLERYERSRMFAVPAPWPRDVILRIDSSEFPEAFAPDGREALEDLSSSARRLASEGAVRLAHFRGLPAERPREVRLGPGEVDRAYAAAAELGFQPLARSLGELAAACSRLRQSALPDWMASFMDRLASGARKADLSILGMRRERLKRGRADVLDALAAAAALASGLRGWERVVSERVFSDSKRLGAIRSVVSDLLQAADPRWEGIEPGDPEAVLESYGVRRKPGLLQSAGAAELQVRGQRYRLEDFVPTAHLPEDWGAAWAEGVACASPRWITTIENEFPFLSYVLESGGPEALGQRGELVVYTAGFPSEALLQALCEVSHRAPATTFRHWGDADGGGMRIWWFIRCRLGRVVELFRTTAQWLEGEASRGREVDSRERRGLQSLAREIMEHPSSSEPDLRAAQDLIEALLRVGRKVEQERW